VCVDGYAQGGGVVWCHGGIDSLPYKVSTLILPRDESVEDDESEFLSVCSGVRSGFAGLV
jgi:hypothetical protein